MTSNFLYDFNFRDQPDLYDNTVARGHTERKSVGRSLAEGLMRPLRVTLTVASGCIHHLSPCPNSVCLADRSRDEQSEPSLSGELACWVLSWAGFVIVSGKDSLVDVRRLRVRCGPNAVAMEKGPEEEPHGHGEVTSHERIHELIA